MDKEEKKKKKIQKVTQRVLVAFIITMIVLTVVSKIANSITVPTATVEKVGRGGIVYDIEGQGELVASDDYKIDVINALEVNKVLVKNGERIAQGDVLLQYDTTSIENAIATQYKNLLSAQQDYLTKKSTYEENLANTELTDAQKVAKEAQEEFEKAEIDLAKAQARYDEKMSELTSKLQEDQLNDYEQVTEARDQAKKTYEDCQKQYDEKFAKAEEVLQEASDTQGYAIRDAQREYDSAKLAYDEYCKEFNRVNDAFLAFVNGVSEIGSDPDQTLQKKMLIEYFGQSTYEMIIYSNFEDIDAYEQNLSTYNKIITLILEYENEVSVRSNLTTKEAIDQANEKISNTYQKLYDFVVKPFEVDKVTSNEKQLNVTTTKEKLDQLIINNEKAMKDAENTYNQTVKQLDEELKTAKDAYDKVQRTYDKTMQKVYQDTDGEDNLLATLESAQEKRDTAEKAVETAEAALTKEEKDSMNEDSLLSLSEHALNASMMEITEIEDTIKQLENLKNQDGSLCAPSDGTITELTVNNYSTTTGEEKIVVASNQCYFRGSFSKDYMDYVEIGDEINLKLNGVKKTITIEASKVYLDAKDNTIAYVEAILPEGEYAVGTTGSFSYQKSGETSENCINITAIRQEGNEYYVLIPQEENSILGDITKACRITVRILNKDSKTAIVEGAISSGDLVITGSSKIIQEGDVVRINN